MKSKKKKCEFCGELFIPNIHNQKYCKKKECRRFSKKTKEEKERYIKNLEKKLKFINGLQPKNMVAKNKLQPKNMVAKNIGLKRSFKQEISNIHQPLYQVKKGFNLIKKFNKIHEDLVNYMNILKLDTYPEEIKNHCIYIMKESNKFLQNQLKLERDKGVVIVQEE